MYSGNFQGLPLTAHSIALKPEQGKVIVSPGPGLKRFTMSRWARLSAGSATCIARTRSLEASPETPLNTLGRSTSIREMCTPETQPTTGLREESGWLAQLGRRPREPGFAQARSE